MHNIDKIMQLRCVVLLFNSSANWCRELHKTNQEVVIFQAERIFDILEPIQTGSGIGPIPNRWMESSFALRHKAGILPAGQ